MIAGRQRKADSPVAQSDSKLVAKITLTPLKSAPPIHIEQR
jgi:hypothetical protein